MKKLLAIAALTAMSTSAFAGLELKYRGDYASTGSYKIRNGADTASRSEFLGNYARLFAAGKVGEGDVKMSLNFLGFSGATGSTNMQASSFVDYLYYSRPVADGMAIHLGKIETALGGIEGANDAAGNEYLVTLANGGYAGAWTGTPAYANPGELTGGNTVGLDKAAMSPFNNHGLGLTYNYGMGQVDAYLTNNSSGQGATTNVAMNQATDSQNWGLAWSGNFMDGMIKPVLHYGKAFTGTTAREHMNLGANFAINDAFDLVAEYLATTGTSKTAANTNSEVDKVTSTYVELSYKADAWKPFAKIEMSTFKNQTAAGVDDDNNSYDRTGVVAGVEYTPKASEMMSYHLAYLSTSDKYKASTGAFSTSKDTVAWSQILAGFKVNADLLK